MMAYQRMKEDHPCECLFHLAATPVSRTSCAMVVHLRFVRNACSALLFGRGENVFWVRFIVLSPLKLAGSVYDGSKLGL